MLLKRLSVFPENTSTVLNQFVIYVSLPALVLLKVPTMTFSSNVLATVIVPWVLLAVSAVLLIFCAKVFNWKRQTLGALLLIVPLGNTSFLGVPMVRAFYGEVAVAYALMYDQLGSFLALAIYGSIVLAFFSKQKNQQVSVSSKEVLIRIITFPPFISLIMAFFLCFVTLPQLYFDTLHPVAMTLVPVVMIAVGFQLSLKLEPDKISPFIIGLSIKMIIAPALILLFFMAAGLQGIVYQVIVFEAAMPPMISAGALAIMAKLSPKLTAAMLAYGIILSFVTLPLLYNFQKLIL